MMVYMLSLLLVAVEDLSDFIRVSIESAKTLAEDMALKLGCPGLAQGLLMTEDHAQETT